MRNLIASFFVGLLFSTVVTIGWAKHVRANYPVITEAKCLEIMSK